MKFNVNNRTDFRLSFRNIFVPPCYWLVLARRIQHAFSSLCPLFKEREGERVGERERPILNNICFRKRLWPFISWPMARGIPKWTNSKVAYEGQAQLRGPRAAHPKSTWARVPLRRQLIIAQQETRDNMLGWFPIFIGTSDKSFKWLRP